MTDLYPKRLPDLFRAEPLVAVRPPRDGDAARCALLGRTHGGPVEEALPFDTRGAHFHPGVTTLWRAAASASDGRLAPRPNDDEKRGCAWRSWTTPCVTTW